MKLPKLPEISPYEPPEGLHRGLTERVVYSISRSSVELNNTRPRAFDQFVTLANVHRPSFCYFDQYNIFLINKFCPSFTDKILKEGKLENCIKASTKILLLFFSLVLPWLSVYTNRETTFTKTFCFVLLLCSLVFNLFKKNNKRKTNIQWPVV